MRAATRHDAGARDRCRAAAASRRRRRASTPADPGSRHRRHRRLTPPAARCSRHRTATPPATPPRPSLRSRRRDSGSAQVILSPPGRRFRVGGGPYTVPISITNVVAAVDDHADGHLRPGGAARPHRAGGQLHAVRAARTRRSRSRSRPGRVDITITRAGDATGASGTGLLAAVLFDAVAPGTATLTLSGAGNRSRRHRDGAAVPAGDDHGST